MNNDNAPTVDELIAEARNPHWVYDIDPEIRTLLIQLAAACEKMQKLQDRKYEKWHLLDCVSALQVSLDEARQQLAEAQALADRYKAALEWYGDESNYFRRWPSGNGPSSIGEDDGERARQALRPVDAQPACEHDLDTEHGFICRMCGWKL